MWLIYTLITAVVWGIGQIFIKKGLKNISPLINNILSTFLGLLIMVPFALYNGVDFDKIAPLFPLMLIVPVFFFCYFYVIGHGQLSLTGTIVGTYPLVTVILSLIFLHESPSIFQKLAIGLIICGATAIAMPDKMQKIKIGSWLWRALVAVIMIGTGDFFIKVLINQSDLYTYLFTYSLTSAVLTTLLVFVDKKGRVLPKFSKKLYLPTFIGVAMIELGFFLFHIAASQGLISLVSPISSIYVGITALLAWIFLKEKINKIQFLGIALSVLGVILVGIS